MRGCYGQFLVIKFDREIIRGKIRTGFEEQSNKVLRYRTLCTNMLKCEFQ